MNRTKKELYSALKEMIKECLPKVAKTSIKDDNFLANIGYNYFRQEFLTNLKEKWGIEMSKE